MNTLKTSMLVIILLFFGNVISNAQTVETETFKVCGNCNMCKKTIESSLKVPGVEKADWNKETKIITVTFNPSIIKAEQIHKNISQAGYDTEKQKGDDKAYKNLAGCCQYERKQ